MMKKELAKRVLEAVKSNNTDLLSELGVEAYGNKGRFWTTTACITNLDSIKSIITGLFGDIPPPS